MMPDSSGKRGATLIPESMLSDRLSSEPALDRAIQERIGDHLRAMYDDLMQQPVPDRFVELLKRLEKRNDNGHQ
jgi:Anti-sigma factor NepR